MSDTPKTGLELQIEQEAKELDSVPRIPIHHFYGAHSRCHICGQLYNKESGIRIERHVPGSQRMACPTCSGGGNG